MAVGIVAAYTCMMRPQSRRIFRLLAAMLLVPTGLYLAAAGVLSHVPVNNNWHEPADGVTIYLASNGVHTGIVVPMSAAGVDWRTRARPTDLSDPSLAGQWLIFGWGDRDFYLNTPTWREVRPGTALSALVGSGKTLVHVYHLGAFYADTDTRPMRLRADEYRRLAAFIEASFSKTREVSPGYGARDVFYAGRGNYNVLRTCNVWTGNAMKAAGVRTAVWSPFTDGIMRWVANPSAVASARGDGR